MKTTTINFLLKNISTYLALNPFQESVLLKKIAQKNKQKFPQVWPSTAGLEEVALLQFLIFATNALKIIEIGTFTGYAIIAMAEAVQKIKKPGEQTSFFALENNDILKENAERFIDKFNKDKDSYRDVIIQLAPGDNQGALSEIAEDYNDGYFDLVFINADPKGGIDYYRKSKKLVASGGMIVVNCPTQKLNELVLKDRTVNVVHLPIKTGVTLIIKK